MTRAAQKLRSAEIIALHKEGLTQKDIAAIVSANHGPITENGVQMVLKRAGRVEPRKVQVPKGEEEYPKGFCLMCKGGKFTHRHWPDGVCPTCGGTGEYPDSIMKGKEVNDAPTPK